jgi:demethylmenaquinone methyltransferase/2-methoxy-6-polyprenyl-1,4-benzoquinol methylase
MPASLKTPEPPAVPESPAWSSAELATDPHARADKADRVRSMFSAIAPAYDLNNRLHSMWRDQAWRRHAVRAAELRQGDRVLDVACGTGDLTELFARDARTSVVVGGDFTPRMLDLARDKQRRLAEGARAKITYADADAMALAFDDGSFDVVSIAFGLRNVQDPERALSEFFRVLRPGGRLVVLEFDRPTNRVFAAFNDLYCARIMPVTATLISGDRSGAYRYLPKSVGTFLTAAQLRERMERAGFVSARSRALTLGICACTVAAKPG